MPKLQDLDNRGTLIYKQLQPGNLFVDERSQLYGVDKVLFFVREEVSDDASAPLACITGASLKCFCTHLIIHICMANRFCETIFGV